MNTMNYARSIRLLRATLGVTQQELAEMTGLRGSSLLSHIEAGRRTLSEKNKQLIAKSLQIPPSIMDLFALEPTGKHTDQEIADIGKAIIKLSKIAHAKEN